MSADPIDFNEEKAKRMIMLDPDKIDSGLSVLLHSYPKIELLRPRFFHFWVLLRELDAELGSAQISQDLLHFGFTSETVLAIYLCRHTANCPTVQAAWIEACHYLSIDGNGEE